MSAPRVRLVLASASPRRADLLRAAGVVFDVRAANVDETIAPGEAPEAYVRRMAEAKAGAIAREVDDAAVLGADTIVLVDAAILGKPRDPTDARRMLTLLSGRAHEVLTSVTLVMPDGDALPRITRVERTTVEFSPLTEAELDWYVASGEPLDKAGAYAIQGLASRFVTRIDGSYSNVVGLPVATVCDLCKQRGILVS